MIQQIDTTLAEDEYLVLLTSPQKGIVGIVGKLDVDFRTGQLLVPPDFAENLQGPAQVLAISATP